MKTFKPLLTESITAAADTVKNRFIGFDGALCNANVRALGVSETDTKAGQQLPVVIKGIAIIVAAGVIAAGAAVASDANGKASAASAISVTIPAGGTAVTSSAAQPNLVVNGGKLPQAINGYALDAAGADGDLIRVVLG
ncbi:MAG: DUF2190 family protein [Deltaproteobacteria bacterium]|nr:DUF2190 family protein [Deltaproteobacteria bacterium]